MKIKQNTWFWLVQIIGWGSLTSVQVITKIGFVKELQKTYILLEGLLVFLIGIIITSFLRLFLKKHVLFKTQKYAVLKMIGAYIIAALLFSCTFFIVMPLYEFYQHKALKVDALFIVSQIVNSFLFLFFWILLYYGIKFIFKQNKHKLERLQLNTSLKESQLNTLKGQINPHFIFNSLNNIRGLMLEDVDRSREMLTRLSEMLRYSLTKTALNKIAIFEELEVVENYIALSKIQLEDRLTFKKEIDTSLLQKEIPPMLIQMLIENAVKHGISNLPKGGTVNLSIKKQHDKIVIIVSNTGKLIFNKTSTKVGLENIKKRLSLLYGDKAIFSLTEKNKEVVATIKIPL